MLKQTTKKAIILIGDILCFYLALGLTLLIRYHSLSPWIWQKHFLPFSFLLLLWLTTFYIVGLYEANFWKTANHFFSQFIKALLANIALSIAFFYFIPHLHITPKRVLGLDIAFFALFFTIFRYFSNKFLRSKTIAQNVLIIGWNQQAREAAEKVQRTPQLGYQIKVILDEQGKNISLPRFSGKIITSAEADLKKIIKENDIQVIVNSTHYSAQQNLARQLYQSISSTLSFVNLPTFYEEITGKVPVNIINEIWFLENLREGEKKLYEAGKRIADIVLALIGIAFAAPLFPFLALAIKLDSPGPILFCQIRCGKNKKEFLAFKLRTMRQDAEKNGPQWAQKNDPRVTRVGKFLRKSRLDEIPQFINILKGEMSFIGPRPERPEFIKTLEKEIPFYQQRLLVKPGLTGWAQVNFPYGASVEDALEKMQYDLFYIKNRSFALDLSILLKTIRTVLRGGGQ